MQTSEIVIPPVAVQPARVPDAVLPFGTMTGSSAAQFGTLGAESGTTAGTSPGFFGSLAERVLGKRGYQSLVTAGAILTAAGALSSEVEAQTIPAIGTVLTNTVVMADGSHETKRYRVTTGVIHRDAQVGTLDPLNRKFPASVNAWGTGTHITDLPNKVLVVSQKGVLRVFGSPDPSRTDEWPIELGYIYSQVSPLNDFLTYGPLSSCPNGNSAFKVVAAPINHPGVTISKRADSFYNVSINYLSGIVSDVAGHSCGQYVIADGSDVVVSGSIPASASGFGGQVVGSNLSASDSAHGVTLAPDHVGGVEGVPRYSGQPMANATWGGDFVGVEEVKDVVLGYGVTLKIRMEADGIHITTSNPVTQNTRIQKCDGPMSGGSGGAMSWSDIGTLTQAAPETVISPAQMTNSVCLFRAVTEY